MVDELEEAAEIVVEESSSAPVERDVERIVEKAADWASNVFERSLQTQEPWNRARLVAAVEREVVRLLDRNPERLMQVLYRVDVPESQLRSAFRVTADLMPLRIAELLVDRQIEKIHLRETLSAEFAGPEDP